MVAARELGHSLHEIYNTLHPANHRAGNAPLLFATSIGQVYSERPFFAFLIKIYDFVMRLFFGGPQQPPVEEALRFVLNTFFNHVAHVAFQGRQKRITHYVRTLSNPTQGQDQRYANFLARELQGSVREGYTPLFIEAFRHRVTPLSEHDLIKLTQISANFEQYITPFWRECIRGDEPSLQLIENLAPFLGDAHELALRDRVLYNAIAKENIWGQLEGVMNRRIPVALLAKLHQPAALTINEREELQNWVARLNESRLEISAEMLSTVLDETAKIISIAGSHPTTFQDIVRWLHQNGCQVLNLNEHDRNYLARTAPLLQPGQRISCEGQEYTLGRVLENQEPGTLAIYEIEGRPELEVRFPINRFVHPISLGGRQPTDPQTIFPLPRVISFDAEGGFLIQERLISSFTDHQWTSHSEVLEPRDRMHAFGFACVLCCLKDWRETFENFSPSDIKLSANGEWKANKQWVRAPYHYQRLEEYCIAAAAGNANVLKYLMQVSKLHETPSFVYYRDVVRGVFTGTMTSRQPPIPNDSEIDGAYAQELMRRAEDVKTRAIDQATLALIRDLSFPRDRLSEISQLVSNRLLEFYLASPTPGHLEEGLVDRVVASIASPTQSQSRASSSSEASNLRLYYEAEYQAALQTCRENRGDNVSSSSSSHDEV